MTFPTRLAFFAENPERLTVDDLCEMVEDLTAFEYTQLDELIELGLFEIEQLEPLFERLRFHTDIETDRAEIWRLLRYRQELVDDNSGWDRDLLATMMKDCPAFCALFRLSEATGTKA